MVYMVVVNCSSPPGGEVVIMVKSRLVDQKEISSADNDVAGTSGHIQHSLARLGSARKQ